jgi:DNA ligase (NAD+)
MGSLSAAKVIRHIQTKRTLSLAVFIAGFNLEGIAETTIEKITSVGFNTLDKLSKATVEDLAAIHGLGEITASVIVDGLKECAKEMDAVLQTGIITIAEPDLSDTPMKGLSFCFTGELKSMKRSEAEKMIKVLGGEVKASIVKGLSYLVNNDRESDSVKNKKAIKLGIQIINEDEFLAEIKKHSEFTEEVQVQPGITIIGANFTLTERLEILAATLPKQKKTTGAKKSKTKKSSTPIQGELF